jgi:hypothetical protein
MDWPRIVAEMLEAMAAILRKHAPVTLEAPTQVEVEVRTQVAGSAQEESHVTAHPD